MDKMLCQNVIALLQQMPCYNLLLYFEIASINAPTNSLKDSNESPKMKTMEEEGIGVHSLVQITLGVRECVRALGWGLGRVTSESIIHMDLHKPNNKLVNA